MHEIIFIVKEDHTTGYIAQAIGTSIVTEAGSMQELRKAVKDVVQCHYADEQGRPENITLRLNDDKAL